MTIAMYRAAVAQARGDTAGTAEQARRILDLAGPDDHLLRGAGAGFLGLALWADGELDAAIETFSDAVRSLRAAGNLADELGATVVLAGMWMARGRPAESGRLHERALASARRRPDVALPVTGDLHVGLADALREQGDLDAAAEHLQAARDLGEAGSLPENRHRWYVAMARLRQAHGDLDAAADLLEQAQALYLPGFFPDVRPIPALRARIDIARGHLDLARDWAREHHVTPVDDLSYLAECNHLTLARLLIAERQVDEALALLDRLHTAAESSGREGSVAEILMLRALAHRAGGDLDKAMAPFARALETAVPVGYARLFLDEGAPMQALLREAEQRGLPVPLLRRPCATPVRIGRGTQPSRARRPPAARDGADRPRYRAPAVRVGQHAADPHQAHLHQARREHACGGRPARHRARPPLTPPESPTRSHRVVMWAHQPASYRHRRRRTPRPAPRSEARHDRHHDLPHPSRRRRRGRRRADLHRRPDQPSASGRHLDRHHRGDHPRHPEGRDGRAGAGRHHRHVPEPGPPQRSPRTRRLPAARPRLPPDHVHRLRRGVRPARRRRNGPLLRRRTSSPRPPAAPPPAISGRWASRSSSRTSPTWPAASSSASPCTGPGSSPAGRAHFWPSAESSPSRCR